VGFSNRDATPDDERLRHGTLGRTAPSWAYTSHAFSNGWALLAIVFAVAALGLSVGPSGMGLSSALPLVALSVMASTRARRITRRNPWRGGGRTVVASWSLCAAALGIGLFGAIA